MDTSLIEDEAVRAKFDNMEYHEFAGYSVTLTTDEEWEAAESAKVVVPQMVERLVDVWIE